PPKQVLHTRLRQAVDTASLRLRPICPALPKAEPAQQACEVTDGVTGVAGDRILLRIPRPGAGVLDVIHVAAKPSQPLQVVEQLPGQPRERYLAGKAENHDERLLTHEDLTCDQTGEAPEATGARPLVPAASRSYTAS